MLSYRFLCAIIVLLTLPTTAPAYPSDSYTGLIETVESGGQFVLSGKRLRLWGIDAPDADQACLDSERQAQRCGLMARLALDLLTTGRRLDCRTVELGPGSGAADAAPARCTVEGYDLNGRMVLIGYAFDRPESGGLYAAVEAQAKERRTGMWGGVFVPPAVWRDKRLGRR
ncbi:thermonuclease family protein [Azospirillum doebereinerae]